MKARTKALLLTLCAVLLVAATVLATVAYLKSTDSVVNTFTVGNVKITLDEAKVDMNGSEDPDESRVHGNEYKLMPGHTYTKDPTVHIDPASEDCYVRMLVTFNKAREVAAICPDGIFNGNDWTTGYDATTWIYNSYKVDESDPTGDTVIYEFRYNGTVVTGTADLAPLFEEIKLPGDLTNEQLATLEGFQITITAEAIQADGFDGPEAAFAALDAAK